MTDSLSRYPNLKALQKFMQRESRTVRRASPTAILSVRTLMTAMRVRTKKELLLLLAQRGFDMPKNRFSTTKQRSVSGYDIIALLLLANDYGVDLFEHITLDGIIVRNLLDKEIRKPPAVTKEMLSLAHQSAELIDKEGRIVGDEDDWLIPPK